MTTIREYAEDDLPALRKLIGALHDELRPFDEYLAPAERILDKYIAYLFDACRRSSGTFLVAAQRERVVGFVCVFGLVPPEEPDQYPDGFSAVANLYVEPPLRGIGIGADLMRRAEDYARALGAGRIELGVLSENHAALDFYRRIGYRERVRTFTKKL